MSWHTSGLILRRSNGDLTALLAAIVGGKRRIEDRQSWDEILEDGQHLAVATTGAWLVIIDPFLFLHLGGPPANGIWPQALEQLFERHATSGFTFLLEGTSATYGFALYDSGSKTRCHLIQDDRVLVDDGEPTSAEVELHEEMTSADGEEFVLRLMERLTLPLGTLETLEFDVFE